MRIERFLLWLVALLVALHCYLTMLAFPEFHVLAPSKVQELVSSLDFSSKGQVQSELMMGRWSGLYAQNLAEHTILIDVALFVIVGILIARSYWRRKNVV